MNRFYNKYLGQAMSLVHLLWKRIEYIDEIHHADALCSSQDELIPGQ